MDFLDGNNEQEEIALPKSRTDYTTLESHMKALATLEDLISATRCGRPGAAESLRARLYIAMDEDDTLMEVAEAMQMKLVKWIEELRGDKEESK